MHYNWIDYTSAFKEACKELKVGELVHDSHFGLFEAMSAIEMMDPKMDAGLVSNVAARKHRSVDEAVKNGELKMSGFTGSELVAIMDGTLRCLVTWMDGYSLAQTVFVNMYAHKPYDVDDRSLKAFTLGVLKVVEALHDVIQQASVYEEEDFQPMTYGFRFGTEVTDVRVGGMLREVEDELNRAVKATRSRCDQPEPDEEQRTAYRSALSVHCRIKFVRLLLAALSQIRSERFGALAAVHDSVPKLLELLSTVRQTGCDVAVDSSGSSSLNDICGFDTLATHRVLPPTFPRYAAVRSQADALDGLAQFVRQLGRLCEVPDAPDLGRALRFFADFSCGGDDGASPPCVAVRSLLQHAYCRCCCSPAGERPAFGSQPAVDVLRETARSFIAPPSLCQLQPSRGGSGGSGGVDEVRAAVAGFFSVAVRPFGALLAAASHNRARQREKLAAALLELAELQDSADRVDALADSLAASAAGQQQQQRATACYGTWVLYHVISAMVQYALLGFELELYDAREYSYVFWYLHEVLYAWLASVLVRADNCIAEQQEAAAAAADQKVGGGKAGGRSGGGGGRKAAGSAARKGKRPAAGAAEQQRRHANELTYVRASQQLCGGYYRLAVALRCLPNATGVGSDASGCLRPPRGAYDNEEIRYERRFAAFAAVGTPAFAPYAQFREQVARCEAAAASCPTLAAELCAGACRSFQQAHGLLESLPKQCAPRDAEALAAVAKNNFVATRVLAGEYQRGSHRLPKYEFATHKSFPTIKL